MGETQAVAIDTAPDLKESLHNIQYRYSAGFSVLLDTPLISSYEAGLRSALNRPLINMYQAGVMAVAETPKRVTGALVSDLVDQELVNPNPLKMVRACFRPETLQVVGAAAVGGARIPTILALSKSMAAYKYTDGLLRPLAAAGVGYAIFHVFSRLEAAGLDKMHKIVPKAFAELHKTDAAVNLSGKLPGLKVPPGREKISTHAQRALATQSGPGVASYVAAAILHEQPPEQRGELHKRLGYDVAAFWGSIIGSATLALSLVGESNPHLVDQVTSLAQDRKVTVLAAFVGIPVLQKAFGKSWQGLKYLADKLHTKRAGRQQLPLAVADGEAAAA